MTAPKSKISLVDYAASKLPPPCKVCVIPERQEIDEAAKSGVSRRIIHEWLTEQKGYATQGPDGISATALDKHVQNRHHYKEVVGS